MTGPRCNRLGCSTELIITYIKRSEVSLSRLAVTLLTKPVRGVHSMKTACATIKGFEVMRMFKKGQFKIWMYGTRNEVSFINEQFGLSTELFSNMD